MLGFGGFRVCLRCSSVWGICNIEWYSVYAKRLWWCLTQLGPIYFKPLFQGDSPHLQFLILFLTPFPLHHTFYMDHYILPHPESPHPVFSPQPPKSQSAAPRASQDLFASPTNIALVLGFAAASARKVWVQARVLSAQLTASL